MNDFSQIQSVSIDLGLQVDQIDLTYVNELPATYSSLYGENQLPSTVTIGEQGQLIIMVSKYLNNSEKKLAIIRGMVYADFYRRNQYTKKYPHPVGQAIQSYREIYETDDVNRLIKAFEAIRFTTLQKPDNLYTYILETNNKLFPWQRDLGQIIKKRFRQQYIQHSTSLLREGWASLKQMEIMANVLSKKEAIEGALLFNQMKRRPTGIRLQDLGRTLLQQLTEPEINQAIETFNDADLIHRAYTQTIHHDENIAVMFTNEKKLRDYEIVKKFLINLSNLNLYPILKVDRLKTEKTRELTVYYLSLIHI